MSSPVTPYEQRLDRIETKLDKLGEALIEISRVEEKLLAQTERMARFEYRLDQQETDLDAVAKLVHQNKTTSATVERFFWVMVTAGVSSLFYFMR